MHRFYSNEAIRDTRYPTVVPSNSFFSTLNTTWKPLSLLDNNNLNSNPASLVLDNLYSLENDQLVPVFYQGKVFKVIYALWFIRTKQSASPVGDIEAAIEQVYLTYKNDNNPIHTFSYKNHTYQINFLSDSTATLKSTPTVMVKMNEIVKDTLAIEAETVQDLVREWTNVVGNNIEQPRLINHLVFAIHGIGYIYLI